MALFGSPQSFLGIDIGTSSLKLVELLDRKKRVEVSTYAEAAVGNMLADAAMSDDEAVKKTSVILSRMVDRADISSDTAVAALPNAIVFSTVVQMPDIAEAEMERAVHFAAKDIVPANIDDMVLGWSRVGQAPHMETDETNKEQEQQRAKQPIGGPANIPVFLTAAPKNIVDRYLRVMEVLRLKLLALEVETSPLVRSLLGDSQDAVLLVDIGDLATTFHIIDGGTPRVSHSIEYGGKHITERMAQELAVPFEKANIYKCTQGILGTAPQAVQDASQAAIKEQLAKAKHVLQTYEQTSRRSVRQSVLIGGGANMPGLMGYWAREINHSTRIGNPWKGLSYPDTLDQKLAVLAPTYAVAVGLALRGMGRT